MSKQLTYEQIFFRFLKHHRAFSKYKRNCNFTFDHYSQQQHPIFVQEMLQLCGFEWDQTLEGVIYWNTLHYKWEELCTSLNIGRHVYA